MPQAVTHVLIALIVASLIYGKVKDKKSFPLKYVLIGGIAGILPDIDVIAYWFLYWSGYTLEAVHRTFMHSLFVPLLFLVFAIIINKKAKIRVDDKLLRWKYIFLMIFMGICIHLVLDATIAGYIMPFYPFSSFRIGLDLISLLPKTLADIAMPSLDAGLLVLWLIYLEKKHKISRFI